MRRYLLAVVPLTIGALATALALAIGDSRTLVSETSIAWLWLGLGIVATVVWLAILLPGSLRRRAVDAAVRAAVASERDNQARFLARLDHELKNPVTAILAGLSNLDSAQPAVASIQGQAERLSRLTGDLRKLAEVRSVALELEPVNLVELCDEVQDAVAELPQASDRTISLAFPRAPRPLPAVRGDRDLLFLALYNLVSNALKYSSAGDTIEVRGSEREGGVMIEVADTGRGIPEHEHAQVWEELARGRTTLDVPGSGLGLPFVRAIVERHSGSVELSSRPGEGTAVRVALPL